MCGGCGVNQVDRRFGMLGGSYARTVVAKTLEHAGPRVRVIANASGWQFGRVGGPVTLCRTVDALLDAAAAVGVDALDANAFAPHRDVLIDRRSVGADQRDDAIVGKAVPPDRVIIAILGAVLAAKKTGAAQSLGLLDDVGEWTLRIAP